MSVRELLLSLVRRWYLVLVGILLTAGLATFLTLSIPARYEMKSTVLLLPPESSVPVRGNPYLYLGGLAQAVEVLSTRMNTTEIRDPIEKAHPDAEFTIGQDPEATGPILAITVSSSSETDAKQVTQQLLEISPPTLTAMQDKLSVPSASRISSLILTPDAKIEKVTKGRDRAVLAAVGAGLAVTVLLTGLIDGLILGRISVRRRRPDPDQFISPAAPPPAPPSSSPSPRRASPSTPTSAVDPEPSDHEGAGHEDDPLNGDRPVDPPHARVAEPEPDLTSRSR